MNHSHRWLRCLAEQCSSGLGYPHWHCGCGEATDYPPGEHHFMTPERIARGSDGPPEPVEADWVVIRPGPNLPHTLMPPELDGMWLDRSRLPTGPPAPGAVAHTVPAGRLESRLVDGEWQVGEVWELEPVAPESSGD